MDSLKPDVTVIIPVYNVEQYLNRCVDSVVNQSLSNIEIILVDDGSPDGSPRICDEYAKCDHRIHVIHKKNGGLASSRNAGMRIATGEYIFFLDSDDWIDPNTLLELHSSAKSKDVDFIRFRQMYAGWPGHEDGTLIDFGTENELHEGLYLRDDIKKVVFPRLFGTEQLTLGIIVSACRSMYKTEFLIGNQLYFDENIKYSEDTLFSAKVLLKTNSFYYVDGPKYYHYFYNPSSITRSFRKDRWESHKRLIAAFDKEFHNNKEYDFTRQLWQQKIYYILNALLQRDYLNTLSAKFDYCKQICNDSITVEAMKHLDVVSVPRKLRILLELIKLKMYYILALV